MSILLLVFTLNRALIVLAFMMHFHNPNRNKQQTCIAVYLRSQFAKWYGP